MPKKPRLAVTHVWVMERVIPYDGSEIVDVYFDVDAAKKGRQWEQNPDGVSWFEAHDLRTLEPYMILTRHEIRS